MSLLEKVEKFKSKSKVSILFEKNDPSEVAEVMEAFILGKISQRQVEKVLDFSPGTLSASVIPLLKRLISEGHLKISL